MGILGYHPPTRALEGDDLVAAAGTSGASPSEGQGLEVVGGGVNGDVLQAGPLAKCPCLVKRRFRIPNVGRRPRAMTIGGWCGQKRGIEPREEAMLRYP